MSVLGKENGSSETYRGVGLELADDALGEAEPLEEHEGLADALTLLVHVLRDEHVPTGNDRQSKETLGCELSQFHDLLRSQEGAPEDQPLKTSGSLDVNNQDKGKRVAALT